MCGQLLYLYQQWFGENHPILLRGGGLEEWSGDKFDKNLSKRAIDQDQEGQIDQFANNNVHKLLKEDKEGHIHKYTNLRSIFITMYTNWSKRTKTKKAKLKSVQITVVVVENIRIHKLG